MNRQIEMGIEIERQIDKQIVYRQINREREIGRNRKNTKTTKEGRKNKDKGTEENGRHQVN